nr:uncharacterized protein LOC125420546 [Ziziphus jujuba var. spinosa]
MSSSSFVIDESKNMENLFQVALRGKWGEVEKIDKKDPRSYKLKITRMGGTPLHTSVAEEKESVVKLVNEICKKRHRSIEIENDEGYTPLHHPASVGEADPSLLGIRTKNKDTPLFIAALHGKMDVFLYLHSVIICSSSSFERDNTRRLTDSETVLHVAIAHEFFGIVVKELKSDQISNPHSEDRKNVV